jgi:hypothetical protein
LKSISLKEQKESKPLLGKHRKEIIRIAVFEKVILILSPFTEKTETGFLKEIAEKK